LFKTRQAKLIPRLYKKQATTGDWLVLDLSNNHVLPQMNAVDPVCGIANKKNNTSECRERGESKTMPEHE
jgi:hypothetical protein